jgi:AraC family transcriptional regulator, regulatory protein of adaptative response / DNA-3-methyladenine glycosylase II
VDHRTLPLQSDFSLAQTCGPVAWGKGRWPSIDWLDGLLVWNGWEAGRLVIRTIRQVDSGLDLTGGDPQLDLDWLNRFLGFSAEPPAFADGPLAELQARFTGLRPYANGSIFEGLVTSIVGQSISVAGAAVTERKLSTLFADSVDAFGRRFWPFPLTDQLAAASPELIRQSGVTWRRAEAIVAAAKAELNGDLPGMADALSNPDEARRQLRALPLVGPWTAESTLLWGIGLADAHPTGDIALLRAARTILNRPDLDLKSLDRLAEDWRPWRAWAARYLWTALLGTADGS